MSQQQITFAWVGFGGGLFVLVGAPLGILLFERKVENGDGDDRGELVSLTFVTNTARDLNKEQSRKFLETIGMERPLVEVARGPVLAGPRRSQ